MRHLTLATAAFLAMTYPTNSGLANVVGADFQHFNPTTSGLDFVTVQSSETLLPGIVNFGLFLNYSANALPEFEDDKVQRVERGDIRNSVIGTDFNIGFGIMENWDIGLSFPMVSAQEISDEDAARIQFSATGLSEVRLNTKIRLWGESDYGVAVVGTIGLNQIEDNPMAGEDPEPTTAVELAADTTIDRVAMGINLGYRWRTPGQPLPDFPMEPFDDQYIYSTAVSYHFPSVDTKLIGEVYASAPANDDPEESQELQKSAEALIGFKSQTSDHHAWHGGLGTYVQQTAVTPDYRVYLGMHYTVGPIYNEPTNEVKKVKRKRRQKKAPAMAPTPPPIESESFVLNAINFQFDSDFRVLPGAKNSIRQIFENARASGRKFRIIVEGHTDSFGSDEYNRELGQRRAEKIRLYLIKTFAIDPNIIDAVSYGETDPIADNGNYQGRQENRRVELKIEYEQSREEQAP